MYMLMCLLCVFDCMCVRMYKNACERISVSLHSDLRDRPIMCLRHCAQRFRRPCAYLWGIVLWVETPKGMP